MIRKPEHYPKWLREIIFCPFDRVFQLRSREDRWDSLKRILDVTYRVDPTDSLLFDIYIDHEREVIKLEKEIEKLNDRISKLERKLG